MQTTQSHLQGWNQALSGDSQAQCVLVFGPARQLREEAAWPALRAAFPAAIIAGCSTAGEIASDAVCDNGLVITAIRFSTTTVRCASFAISQSSDSRHCGQQLANALQDEQLVHLLVLCDGLLVNGSELIRGMRSVLQANVSVSGGLAADGTCFMSTVVVGNGPASSGVVVAIGFYGPQLRVGCGALGGWTSFGPDRRISASRDNVVYELDGMPALDLYRSYLGQQAGNLPCSGLFFPLGVELEAGRERVVRTIVGFDASDSSLVFAGDMPQGAYAQLMHSNFKRLIFGAVGAAHKTRMALGEHPVQLAILISCVGRRLVLAQRVEEEVEGVREVLGADAMLTGFYSYGEIAPHSEPGSCELHNQTMTITAFCELD